jgi:3-dehydroquinate synthase
MNHLTVELGAKSYPIMLGTLPEYLPELLKKVAGRSVLIVTDENVDAAGHLDRLSEALARAEFMDFQSLILPPGEEYKTFEYVGKIAETAAAAGLDRKSILIALSGGVIGDMTGFAAAIYMRGIDFIQLPTTLLAAVDSSVGGKTGADLPAGKNLIGAFHQPLMVALDTEALKTLPATEYRNGLAEVVKYGVIMDKEFFTLLESNVKKLNTFESEFYVKVIKRCCECKAEVVASDEREQGLRAILNYGHTVGHAVEKLSDYTLPHGRAVAIGMAAAARLAVNLSMLDVAAEVRQNQLLKALDLPTRLPANSAVDQIVQAMKSDKKNSNGKINMILPRAIGAVEIVKGIDEAVLKHSLEELL